MKKRNTLVMSYEAADAIGLDADRWLIMNPDVAVLNRCYDALIVVKDADDLEVIFRSVEVLGTLTIVGLFGFDDIINQLTMLSQVPLAPTLGYVESDGCGRFFRCYALKVQ